MSGLNFLGLGPDSGLQFFKLGRAFGPILELGPWSEGALLKYRIKTRTGLGAKYITNVVFTNFQIFG